MYMGTYMCQLWTCSSRAWEYHLPTMEDTKNKEKPSTENHYVLHRADIVPYIAILFSRLDKTLTDCTVM